MDRYVLTFDERFPKMFEEIEAVSDSPEELFMNMFASGCVRVGVLEEPKTDDALLGVLVRQMPELGGVVSLVYTHKDEYAAEGQQDETWRVWFGARSYSNTVGPYKSVEAALREALKEQDAVSG